MRAAAYIRVSSKSQTLDMQRAAIERAARTRRDTITDWYSEQSARTLARPGLEKLRQAAREGRVPRLYVYRLDRLGVAAPAERCVSVATSTFSDTKPLVSSKRSTLRKGRRHAQPLESWVPRSPFG